MLCTFVQHAHIILKLGILLSKCLVESEKMVYFQETRLVFIPVHDRDYYLVKAAALNRLIDKGPDLSKR